MYGCAFHGQSSGTPRVVQALGVLRDVCTVSADGRVGPPTLVEGQLQESTALAKVRSRMHPHAHVHVHV